jgi:transcription elongation factor S-II
MVVATVIALNGTLSDLTIPAKTPDVLEWLRKKYKQVFQYQDKVQDPLSERWLRVFATVGEEDDEPNQHMMFPPFDDYEKPASAYTNLTKGEYEIIYNELSDIAESDEDVEDEDDDSEDEISVEEEVERPAPVVKVITKTKNVFVESPIRELVIQNLTESTSHDIATELEKHLLNMIVQLCKTSGIDVDWANKIFWNTYRDKAISLYENLRTDGYVRNKHNWAEKLLSGEVDAKTFVEMPAEEMCPSRWKEALDKIIETDIKLYSKDLSASIYMYCSRCKKKSKCDYYQMQTRSADEPMTTFVTCLECDREWKF